MSGFHGDRKHKFQWFEWLKFSDFDRVAYIMVLEIREKSGLLREF